MPSAERYEWWHGTREREEEFIGVEMRAPRIPIVLLFLEDFQTFPGKRRKGQSGGRKSNRQQGDGEAERGIG